MCSQCGAHCPAQIKSCPVSEGAQRPWGQGSDVLCTLAPPTVSSRILMLCKATIKMYRKGDNVLTLLKLANKETKFLGFRRTVLNCTF